MALDWVLDEENFGKSKVLGFAVVSDDLHLIHEEGIREDHARRGSRGAHHHIRCDVEPAALDLH